MAVCVQWMKNHLRTLICVKKRITFLHFHWMEAEGWELEGREGITLAEMETGFSGIINHL